MQQPDRLSTGVAILDDLLGGLLPGDNVVWASDEHDLFEVAEAGLITSARDGQLNCLYVSVARPPAEVVRNTDGYVTVLDARPRGDYGDAAVLEQRLITAAREAPPLCVIVDGLDSLAQRWGDAKAAAFFSRVCPRLFDLDAIAYWRAPRPAVSRRVMERITGVTQCVVELSKGRLRLVKAEGRPAASQSRLLRARIVSGELVVEAERALGRLARGLERLRHERQLSQTDLGRLAGVSASAISQTEAGRRGLSIDTLLLLADNLGVTVDELLAVAQPSGYLVARRERIGRHAAITPLLDDPKAGLRVYLVRLAGGESGQPPSAHKGTELILVASGLIQLELGSDTPVLRSGDAALATTVPLSSWRNLTAQPAVLFWIVRDAG
ncbi:MAG: XRE family transcriptional regulator [Ilumatobacteraceae bacterium]